MNYLGDFSEDATVTIFFSTNDGDGGAVAPSSAFEAADVKIYKNGSATEKTATDGLTMTSPFDSHTGLHCLTIDTSDDTNDSGFWVTSADYSVILIPDETVDSQTVVSEIASFSIENRHTAAGSSPPSAADIADAVWNEASTGHTDAGKAGAQLWTDIDAILEDTGTTLDGKIDTIDTNVDQIETAVITNAAGADIAADIIAIKAETANIVADTNELQTDDVPGLIAALDTVVDGVETKIDTIDGNVDSILEDTGTTLDTLVKDIPTVAEFEARTIAAADYVVTSDTIAGVTTVTNLTNAPSNGDLTAAMIASVNGAVDTALDTAISSPTAGSIADYVMRTKYTICNKMEITESNGNTQMYNDAGAAYGSEIAAAFSSDSTTTTRKKLL